MDIQVECHAGHRGEREPRALTLGQRRYGVLEILDRWLTPNNRFFKVRLDDERVLVVHHDIGSGEWDIAALVGRSRPEPRHAGLH
jgi:hypothetical protein